MYTVAPLDGGPVRHVHRSELRAVPEGLQPEPGSSPPPASQASTLAPLTAVQEDPSADAVVVCYEDEALEEPVLPDVPTFKEKDTMSDATPPFVHRSARATAGQHSNPHRLPRSVVHRNEEESLLGYDPDGHA